MIGLKRKVIVAVVALLALLAVFAGFRLVVSPVEAHADEALTWYYDDKKINDGYSVTYNKGRNFITRVSAKRGSDTYTYQSGGLVVTNEDGQTVSIVVDAGEYTFTIAGEDNSLSFTVDPAPINLASSSQFTWVYGGSRSLDSETVNIYSYQYENAIRSYYTNVIMEQAPDKEWTNWTLEEHSPGYVVNSVIGYASRAWTLNVYTPSLATTSYTCEYTNNSTYSITGTQTGMYIARATLEMTDKNYYFSSMADSGFSKRGMTISLSVDGKKAVVDKNWYICYYGNEMLDMTASVEAGKAVPYSIEGWTFGAFPEAGIATPVMQFGDESHADGLLGKVTQETDYVLLVDGAELVHVRGPIDISYELTVGHPDYDAWQAGTKDFVTFTLLLDGNIVCENAVRSQWDSYINQYTPVGEYTVIFTGIGFVIGPHRAWYRTSGMAYSSNATEYFTFSRSYNFTVSPGTLSAADTASGQSYEMNIDEFEGGDYSALFAFTDGKFIYDVAISLAQVKASGTYWAGVAETYYDAEPTVLFSLSPKDEYLPLEADWGKLIATPSTYTLYFALRMKNYANYPENAIDQYEACFTVSLYQELEKPALLYNEFTYSGVEQTASLTEPSQLYTLSGNLATNVGTYAATVSLTDEVHYRWKGQEEKEVSLPFTVKPAAITLPTSLEAVYTGQAQKVPLNIPVDMAGRPVYEIIYPEGNADGFTEEGEYSVQVRFVDGRNYFWVNSAGEVISADDGVVDVSFKITPEKKDGSTLLIIALTVELVIIVVLGGLLLWILLKRRKKKHVKN